MRQRLGSGDHLPEHWRTRSFQVWAYSVSHAQLLLRSPKTEAFPTRAEVLFKSVDEMKLPTLLDGLTIEKAGDEQAREIAPSSRMPVFVIGTRGATGHVVAGVCYLAEDDGEYNQPILLLKLLPGLMLPRSGSFEDEPE